MTEDEDRRDEEERIFAKREGWYKYRLTLDWVKLGNVTSFLLKVRSHGLTEMSYSHGSYSVYIAIAPSLHSEYEVRTILNAIDGVTAVPIINGLDWDHDKIIAFDLTRVRC